MPRPFDIGFYDNEIFDAFEFSSIGSTPSLELYSVVPARGGLGLLGDCYERTEQLTSPSATQPLRCTGKVVVQIAGDAVGVIGQVERSTTDPGVNPNWAPQGALLTGNPAAAGIEVMSFVEPARAWWRFNASLIDDGLIDVTISGGKG